MSDKKLTQLPLITPEDDDLMYIVHKPDTDCISAAVKYKDVHGDGGGGDDWVATTIVKSAYGRGGVIFLTENGKLYASRSFNDFGFFTGMTVEPNRSPIWGVGSTIVQIPVPTNNKLVDIAVVGQSGYVLDEAGNLYSCGAQNFGQLGQGIKSGDPQLTYKFATDNVEKMFYYDNGISRSNDTNTCMFVRKTDGRIYGCGYNGMWNLGLGDKTYRASFVPIPTLDSIAADIKGILHLTYQSPSIAWTDDKVYICGVNNNYEFGNGTNLDYTTFTNATLLWNPDGYKIEKFDCAQEVDSFAIYGILTNGPDDFAIKVAGYNKYGQLGIIKTNGASLNPVKTVTTAFASSEGFKDLRVEGQLTAAVLTKSKKLYKTGYNTHGMCADGTVKHVRQFKQVLDEVDELLSPTQGSVNYPGRTIGIIKVGSKIKACGYNGDTNHRQSGTGSAAVQLTAYHDILFPGKEAEGLIEVNEIDTGDGGRCFISNSPTYKKCFVWGWNGGYALFDRYAKAVQVPAPISSQIPVLKGWI
jgi:alpha-tubulin suppressor-like RCC1 family protein